MKLRIGNCGIFNIARFVRKAVGAKCSASEGHIFKRGAWQAWECNKCGEVVPSEPGPPWDGGASFLVPPVASGPNCGWESRKHHSERMRCNAEREAYEATWRTRQGHDIHPHDEHWLCVHLCRSWPDSTPGMEPYYVWVCRRCGEEIRQQIASSFSYSMSGSEPVAIGMQDQFSQPGGLEHEGDYVLTQRMSHLQSHGIDVEPIMQRRRRMQSQIALAMSNVTCHMPPGQTGQIARQSMVFR